MDPKQIKTYITHHDALPNIKYVFQEMYADNVETIIATDGVRGHAINTELKRTKTDFSGKPIIGSTFLRGLDIKPLMPTISIPHDLSYAANLTLDFGGVSFTQKFRRREGYKDFDAVFFGAVLLDDTHHRIMQTYLRFQSNNVASAREPLLNPIVIKQVLEKGEYITVFPTRAIKMELVKETTNEHIKKVTNCGLIIKRTATFFNKERKEDISYYVITATGRVMVFEGEHNTFDTPAKTGYVLLSDPIKVTK